MTSVEQNLERVRKLRDQGQVSEDQAQALISAILADLEKASMEPDSGPDSQSEPVAPASNVGSSEDLTEQQDNEAAGQSRHRRRRAGRHSDRSRRRASRGDQSHRHDEGIGDLVGNVVGSALGALTGNLVSGEWHRDNQVRVSSLANPEGDHYEIEDNDITASSIAGIILYQAVFSDNVMRGSSIKSLSLNDGQFRDVTMNGASLVNCSFEDFTMRDVSLNGAGLNHFTMEKSALKDCRFNGANFKQVHFGESSICDLQLNGTSVRDSVVMAGTEVQGLTCHGGGFRDLVLETATVTDVKFIGASVAGLEVRRTSLTDVLFGPSDAKHGHHGRCHINGLRMKAFKGTDLTFRNCRFDDTTFEQCDISDLTFEDVDFSGMTLTSEADFRQLAQ